MIARTRGGWLVLLLAVVCAGGGYAVSSAMAAVGKEAEGHSLLVLVRMKAEDLGRWRAARLSHAIEAAGSASRLPELQSIAEGRGGEDDARVVAAWLEALMTSERVVGVTLLGPIGSTLAARGDTAPPKGMAVPAATEEAALTPLFAEEGRVRIAAHAPLRWAGRPAGTLVLWMDGAAEVHSLLGSWPVPGVRGQLVLVRRDGEDVVYLSPLTDGAEELHGARRRADDSTLAAALALRAEEGVVEGLDHAGRRVLAAHHAVTGSDWHVLAKAPESDVIGGVRAQQTLAWVAALAIFLALGAAVHFVVRRSRLYNLQRALEAERSARELMGMQARLVDAMNDAVIVFGTDQRIQFWSTSAERMYGWTAGQAIGRTGPELLRTTFPPGSSAESVVERLLSTGAVRMDLAEMRADGTVVQVEANTVPLLSSEGTPSGFLTVNRDVTDRKQTDAIVKSMQSRLAASDRMASMGLLAASVVHEINNPLAYMISNVAFALAELEGDAPDPTEVQRALRDAREGGQRIAQIAGDLKAFARSGGDIPAAEVKAAVDTAARLAGSVLKHRARVVAEIQQPLTAALPERRLVQVLLNLFVNAAQAMPGVREGTITVTATGDGEWITLEVADTGEGIPPDVRARLFEPFFTTKGSDGTGLGLAICRDLVRQAGGEIEFESSVGEGTTFTMRLPRAAREVTAPARARSRPTPGRARVLVVDDEPMVGKAIERILAEIHDVRTVGCPREALAVLREGPRFDVVLCDLAMPRLSGKELYEAVRSGDPEQALRFVFMTGELGGRLAQAFLPLVPDNLLLEKPFEPQTLMDVVARATAARAVPGLDPAATGLLVSC